MPRSSQVTPVGPDPVIGTTALMPAKRRQQVSEPDHRTQDPNPPQQRRPPDSHTEADLRDGLIISTLYLPETTGNVRHRHVPSRSVCAGYTNCPDMTGTVRQWILVIVSYETSVCFGQHDARE